MSDFDFTSYQKEKRAAERKVDIPICANPERRKECENNTKLWFTTYLPHAFPKEFGEPHDIMIERSDNAIKTGGRSAVAEPRGYGKSTTLKARSLKALMAGEKKYCALIGADAKASDKNVKGMILWILGSDLMKEDYPEIWYPISASADGKAYPTAQRAKTLLTGQTKFYYDDDGEKVPVDDDWIPSEFDIEVDDGKPIYLDFKSQPAVLYFPWYPKARCSGAVLFSVGITGGIRGENRHLPDGSIIRPDLVLIDDPQTRESAHSIVQTKARLEIIEEDIAGLAGQGEELSMLCACTVVAKNDLADRLLDRKENPDWRGEKTAMLESFPKHMDNAHESEVNWEEWNKVRIEGLNEDDDGVLAATYYIDNQEILEEGAITTWDGIKKAKHPSPLYSAMELYFKNPKGFYSEYQNDPQDENDSSQKLDRETVLNALNGLEINEVQEGYNVQSVAIDLNDYALSWGFCATKNDMTTNIPNYGQFPAGSKNVWDSDMGISREEAFTNALTDFITRTHSQYPHAYIGVDGNWQTDVVHQVVKQMNRMGIKCFVMRGKGSTQYREKKKNDKRLIGAVRNHCQFVKGVKGNEIEFDSHYWHKTTQNAFRIKSPAPGSLSVYGKDKKKHQEFADHCVADRLLAHFVKDGKVYYDWFKPPHEHNDIFDAVSMAQVLANLNGCDFVEAGQYVRQTRPRRRRKKVAKNFN